MKHACQLAGLGADAAVRAADRLTAVRLLERAMSEPPPAKLRREILAELGQAEALAGLPQAAQRMTDAMQRTGGQRRRAELALAQGKAFHMRASSWQAAQVLEWAMTELRIDDEALASELPAAHVSAASLVPGLAREAPGRRERLLRALASPPTSAQRSAIAHVAVLDSVLGAPRQAVRELADMTWDAGGLTGVVLRDLRVLGLATGGDAGIGLLKRAVRIGRRYPDVSSTSTH